MSHSDTKSALMAPFYRGFETKPKLLPDDIKGIQVRIPSDSLSLYNTQKIIKKSARLLTTVQLETVLESFQALYGPKTEATADDDDDEEETNFIEDRVPTPQNELCRDSKLDAIVTVKDTTTYVFKGSKYWKLIDDGVAPGFPKPITNDWDGLPGNIDAAFTWSNGKTYIFKGSKYWRFTNQNKDDGYPKPISKGFDGIPNDVDAAFMWSGNGKIYFFKVSGVRLTVTAIFHSIYSIVFIVKLSFAS